MEMEGGEGGGVTGLNINAWCNTSSEHTLKGFKPRRATR